VCVYVCVDEVRFVLPFFKIIGPLRRYLQDLTCFPYSGLLNAFCKH